MPIRILVGHKGVGKTALLKRASLADVEAKRFNIWMQPDDLVSIKAAAAGSADFNIRIEAWKCGIARQIAQRLVTHIYGPQALSVAPQINTANTASLFRIISKSVAEIRPENADGVTFYIDDIDSGWSASNEDITQISALLNCIRDISSPVMRQNIKFRLALRSDVYFPVRTSDESTDKIESTVIWLKWTNDDILRLMAMRIQTYFGLNVQQNQLLVSQQVITENIFSKVIEPVFSGAGKWAERPMHKVLLSLTRARPRDLVKLLRGAAKKAQISGNKIITTKNLQDSFEAYSQERLQDIVNEFRSEIPELQKLLFSMKPTTRERKAAESYQFTTDELISKLGNIMRSINIHFTNGRYVSPKSLIQFLYKIDFITARRETEDGIDRRYFDESRFLADEIVDFGYGWEIHPAYRWALQPQDINDVLLDSIFGRR